MTQEFVTLPREVVELAIEALFCTDSEEGSTAYENELKAVKKLRAALDQPQGDQEPVAWCFRKSLVQKLQWQRPVGGNDVIQHWAPLYTHPQPPRQPLTNEEIDVIAKTMPGGLDGFLKGWGWRQFARAIEASHNIK